MLSLSEVRLRRGPQVLIDAATCSIFRGEKVGIVGRNGCGKSTLLALIRGELAPDAGEYRAPPALATAWVAQELPETDATLVEYIRGGDLELAALEAQIREAPTDGARLALLHAEYGHLGGYAARSRAAQLAAGLGFAPDDLERPVRHFSGGLQMRANLARALMRRSDVLLLDEPTNHLDLDMRHALLVALQDFAGAVVIVSHDRALLRGACDRFLLVAGGAVAPFDGDLEDYVAWLARGATEAVPVASPASSRREQRRLEAEARNRLTPLRAEQRTLECHLERLTAERKAIESRLADPATYAVTTAEEQRRLSARHGELAREISTVEERWLEVASVLEAAG